MNFSIGKRLHLLPSNSETSVWGTAVSLLERTDFRKTANTLDAHVSWLEKYVVGMEENLREDE